MKRLKLPLVGGKNPVHPEHVRVMHAVSRHFAYLYGRWGDESEYEDEEDYWRSAANALTDAGATFVSMNMSPFRVVFRLGDSTDAYTIHVKATKGGAVVKVIGPFKRFAPEHYTSQERMNNEA